MARLLRRRLTRRLSKRGRDVEGRVAEEEVARSEVQRHWLGRHDGVVFRGREVGDAEGMPEDDVGVLDGVAARVFDPLRETLGGFAARLGHMPACGVDLVVGVWMGEVIC